MHNKDYFLIANWSRIDETLAWVDNLILLFYLTQVAICGLFIHCIGTHAHGC